MKDFASWAIRTSHDARAICLVAPMLLLALSLHCNPERFIRQGPLKELSPEEFGIEPLYTDSERKIPMLYSVVPDRVPESYVLSSLPPSGDQGKQASGVAWAAGYTATSKYFQARGKTDYVCSPAFLYNALNGGRNEGINLLETLKFITDTGCADQKLMPYDEHDFFRRPTGAIRSAASEFRTKGFGRVDYSDIDQVKGHLLQGSAVIVELKITENFVEADSADWTPAGNFVAVHTVAVIGYDIKRKTVLIQNSAGVKWGKAGQVNISFPWFQRLTQKAYVLF